MSLRPPTHSARDSQERKCIRCEVTGGIDSAFRGVTVYPIRNLMETVTRFSVSLE